MESAIKTPNDIEMLREGGRRLARVLRLVSEHIAPGVSTKELDALAERLIREGGDAPAFLGYHPPFARRAYPASLCVSVHDEVVHGIPLENHILKEGDIVGIDLGLVHGGLIVDSARTVAVGEIDASARKLMDVCSNSLSAGIQAAQAGAHIGDIGYAIESYVKPHGFGIPRELGGHGVGYKVHEPPDVPNIGKPGKGPLLVPGMVLALEPMVNEGTGAVTTDEDGYTIRTSDGKRSAHFEHTIVITERGPQVLTQE